MRRINFSGIQTNDPILARIPDLVIVNPPPQKKKTEKKKREPVKLCSRNGSDPKW